METIPGSAAGAADPNLLIPPSSWEPTEITLVPGASREDVAVAERLLSRYMWQIARRLVERFTEYRTFLDCCGFANPARADDLELNAAEHADVRRLLRRAKRIRNHSRHHARREMARLMGMLERVPLDRLVGTGSGLVAHLTSFPREEPGAPPAAFEVHLPSPDHPEAPVFIRPACTRRGATVFVRGGCHGACQGEAHPLVESCAERGDLSGLLLTALAWARRNVA